MSEVALTHRERLLRCTKMGGYRDGLCVENNEGHKCLYIPTELQALYHQSSVPNLILEGSRGGGKSWCIRWDGHMRCLATPGYNALIIRRVMPELRRSHLMDVGREAEALGADYNRSEFVVRYSNGSTLSFGHAENEKAVERYLSSQYQLIVFDEIVTMTLREFLLISASARSTTDKGVPALVRGATNPIGRGARWVRQYFITKNPSYEDAPDYKPEDWDSIHCDMDENPFIQIEDYEKRMGNLPSEALRRAYRHGEWVTEGTAFSDWRETKDGKPWHVIEELPKYKGKPITDVPYIEIVRSLDWGYSAAGNPGLCLWFACMPDGTAVCFDEYYFKETLPADVAKEIKRRSAGMRVRYTVADPAMFREHTGESLAETFARNGVPLVDGDNERESGWIRMQAWLHETVNDGVAERPRLQFYRGANGDGCPKAIKTIPDMVVDPKKPQDIETRGVEDEAADTVRYFLMSRPAPSKEPPVDEGIKEVLAMIASLKRRNNPATIGIEATRRRA